MIELEKGQRITVDIRGEPVEAVVIGLSRTKALIELDNEKKSIRQVPRYLVSWSDLRDFRYVHRSQIPTGARR